MSSRWRLRGSTSNGRPSGPSMSIGSPGRRRVNHSVPRPIDAEVDRDDPGRRIDGVDRERPTQHHPGVVAGPDVDELAGPRAGREIRRVVGLEPLARQDLAAVDELGRGEPHRHAVGRPSAPLRPRRPPRRRQRPRLRRRRHPRRHRPRRRCPPWLRRRHRRRRRHPSLRRLRRDRGIRLGEGVGQVAEDVGRVVELDELFGAGQTSATRLRRPPGRPRRGTRHRT